MLLRHKGPSRGRRWPGPADWGATAATRCVAAGHARLRRGIARRCRSSLSLGCALAALLVSAPAGAQLVDQNLWGTNGTVKAIARSGNTIYVGGAFTSVGPVTGGGVPVDDTSGQPLRRYAKIAGQVNAVVPDGEGGWYVGGSFVGVGGLPRNNLAHVLADGRVAPWSPDPDDEVTALAVDGHTLYVGGYFNHIAGKSRDFIAAIDLCSGRPTAWNPGADLQVLALLVHRDTLYVGGDFSVIAGQARNRLAALDMATGLATGWNPDIQPGGATRVRALAARGDTVLVGGSFAYVGGSPRRHLAAVSATTGLAKDWNPHVTGPDDSYYGDPYVSALAIRWNTVYVGGHFTGIGGQTRQGLAQVDLATGLTCAWNPTVAEVHELALRDSTLLIGGYFTFVSGQPRRYAAEVSLTTGAATPWNPNANEPVRCLAVDGRTVYVGGEFTGLGSQWQPRMNVAAFDATTGEVTDWNPNPNGYGVRALAVARGKVYIGGIFSIIGGQYRYGIAEVDTLAGLATDWDPAGGGWVLAFAVSGDTLCVGGTFTSMGGLERSRLASFDLATGDLTSWNPQAGGSVYAMAVRGDTVYAAGYLRSVGGLTRRGLAAVDLATGATLDWDPGVNSTAYAIALAGDTVFVGGSFTEIGGQPRQHLAAVGATSGAVLDWTADANSVVYALASHGDTLFVGGSFSNIAGEGRFGLAAFDMPSGALLPWDLELDTSVGALAVAENTLYVGGGHRAGLTPVSRLVAIPLVPTVPNPDSVPSGCSLAWIAPNPVHEAATVRLILPSSRPVTLAVFDVQGRQVTSVLRQVALPAGTHEIPLQARGWREGFYFLRLEAGDQTATTKFVVLR